jgi:hypothetical protein
VRYGTAQSRGLRVAIFDFELVDTSLEGATNGPRADETARLARLGDQLRALVTGSGKLEVIDVAPVRAEARKASLQACGGCDADFAKQLGADLSITGTVQKVSNLILNINLYVRVAETRAHLVVMSVDIRGNCLLRGVIVGTLRHATDPADVFMAPALQEIN